MSNLLAPQAIVAAAWALYPESRAARMAAMTANGIRAREARLYAEGPCGRGQNPKRDGCTAAQRGKNKPGAGGAMQGPVAPKKESAAGAKKKARPGGGGDVHGPITPKQAAGHKAGATKKAKVDEHLAKVAGYEKIAAEHGRKAGNLRDRADQYRESAKNHPELSGEWHAAHDTADRLESEAVPHENKVHIAKQNLKGLADRDPRAKKGKAGAAKPTPKLDAVADEPAPKPAPAAAAPSKPAASAPDAAPSKAAPSKATKPAPNDIADLKAMLKGAGKKGMALLSKFDGWLGGLGAVSGKSKLAKGAGRAASEGVRDAVGDIGDSARRGGGNLDRRIGAEEDRRGITPHQQRRR